MIKKKSYYKLRAYYSIITKDLRNKYPLAWIRKIDMWRHGFLAEKYVLYRFNKYSYNLFLSDYHTSMSRWINEPFNSLLTNKYVFANILGKFIKVPETFGLISRGIYYPEINIDEDYLLEKANSFVIKPVDGGGGKGVYLIKKANDREFLINNAETKNRSQIEKLFKNLDNYLVIEYIEQGKFQKSLNTNSINTMRVLTLFDPQSNKPFIAQAVQRVGVEKSAPQDNFTKGGLSFNIDLETGMLSDGTSHPKTAHHNRFSLHPDTNKQIEGLVIPQWDYIKQQIIHVASKLPMLKCVGWDFLMTDNELVAIEGNHHPDPDVLQAHGPLLTNERVKFFYNYYDII